MKKILLITLTGLVFLTACDKIERSLKGDHYVEQKEALNQAKKAESSAKKEIQKALKAGKEAFPQLSETLAQDESQVIITTSMGDISVKLFPKYAPLAVQNFITHAKEGYYDGLSFHRVIKDFMIQTGDPNGDGTGGQSIWQGKDKNIDSGTGFKNEVTPYLFNLRGALSMANAGPNTNGSQFFINQNPNSQSDHIKPGDYPQPIIEAYQHGGNLSLDGSYTVFGQVIDGMAIVDQIAAVETGEADKPKESVTIKTITVIKEAKIN